MKSEIFIDYGFRLKRKSKRMYLKSIVKAKRNLIYCAQKTNHYCSEINFQAKVFKHNLKDINRF